MDVIFGILWIVINIIGFGVCWYLYGFSVALEGLMWMIVVNVALAFFSRR